MACPFGGLDEHFSSPAEAEAHFAKTMEASLHVSHQKRSPKTLRSDFEAARQDVMEAIRNKDSVAEAKQAWEAAAAEYAVTPEGQDHFTELAKGVDPASAAHATYEHFMAEGNRLRVERLSSDELESIVSGSYAPEPTREAMDRQLASLDQPNELPSTVVKPKFTKKVDWNRMDKSSRIGHLSLTVGDLETYEQRMHEFLENPTAADERELDSVLNAARQLGVPWTYVAPDNSGYTPKEWADLSAKLNRESEAVAHYALSFPAANESHFEYAHDFILTADEIITHPSCPTVMRDNLVGDEVRQKGEIYDADTRAYCRARVPESNRLALYMAVADTDDFHRQEAFNQVVSSPMDTLTEEDRLWMAQNTDKLPTSEVTMRTLQTSLRHWARGYADSEERESLLAALPEEEEKQKRRRGIFGRG